MHGNRAIILYGPPGTGKTYRAKQLACQLLDMDFRPGEEPELQINYNNSFSFQYNEPEQKQEQEPASGFYQVIQFHPNYTYQDFIGGIYPEVNGKQIAYQLRPGVFYTLCKIAEANKEKKFILIIDEINRANLSAVFGELMYALEYRGRPVKIPLFGEFSIPDNVYIIGTMNNTDKSLIGFDLALRRRFGFIKVMPDMSVLDTLPLDHVDKFKELAINLNSELKKKLNLSEDKQIGHAYFLKIKDFCPPLKSEKAKDTTVKAEGEQSADTAAKPEGEQPADTAAKPEGETPAANAADTPDNKEQLALTAYALEKLWDYHLSPLLEEYLGLEFEEKANEIAELKTAFTGKKSEPQKQ